ncbi:MAG: DNA polymerase IV [Pseudomonadota bacterium]
MDKSKTIIHVDMDAFYASIEQRDNPELRGKPVIVGGTRNRGVVAAASYEVREFGVRSAMPTKEALRRCPQAICVRPRMDHYKSVSTQVFSVFRNITPLVEGLSLDEAFLDISDSMKLFGTSEAIARRIKNEIKKETGLNSSVGVAPNKLVAKIASDLDKPDGLCILTPDNLQSALDPLPVRALWGIGKTTGGALKRQGIKTMGELRQAPDAVLRSVFGRFSETMRLRASGVDDREVSPHRDDKSISNEETYDYDLSDRKQLVKRLMALTEQTCNRMRQKQLQATVVTVKLRNGDFVTNTRQQSFKPPSNETGLLFQMAKSLLIRWLDEHPNERIRLLGMGVAGLCQADQLSLFGEPDTVDRTVDGVNSKFGERSISRARRLDG